MITADHPGGRAHPERRGRRPVERGQFL